jgi:hypothetical protein
MTTVATGQFPPAGPARSAASVAALEPRVQRPLRYPRRLPERLAQAPQRARTHRIHRNPRLGKHRSIIVKSGITRLKGSSAPSGPAIRSIADLIEVCAANFIPVGGSSAPGTCRNGCILGRDRRLLNQLPIGHKKQGGRCPKICQDCLKFLDRSRVRVRPSVS